MSQVVGKEEKSQSGEQEDVDKLKADRLYKRFGDGGLLLGCVSGVRRNLSVGSLYLI